MTYTTTMTKKGQITIPKEFRDLLKLKTASKLVVTFDAKSKGVLVKQTPDLFDLAGTFNIKKRTSVLKARDAFEQRYERS